MCALKSTENARTFGRGAGYSEAGPSDGKFGTTGGHPMSKRVAARKA
jgi:hypothetical protein